MPQPRVSRIGRLTLAILVIVLMGAATLAPGPAAAAAPTDKDMTFFLHFVNATETSKTIPGAGSTWTYFDTTTEWNDTNVTFTADGSQQTFSWYLAPALAGPVTVTGFSLSIWAQFISGTPNAQTTVDLVERDATGSESVVESANFGSQGYSVTPALQQLNWTLAAAHTFDAGTSIKLSLKVNPGSGAVVFVFDTARADSRVSLRTADAVAVSAIDVQDASGASTSSLDPQAADTTARFVATVSDPYGGYDVARANVTILSPTGAVLVDNASMARTGGTPISLDSEFTYAWDYSSMPPGQYQVFVYVMDNNGVNWFDHFAQFSTGPYGDWLGGSFFIGSLPLFAWFEVVDDHAVALEDATVTLEAASTAVSTGQTAGNGLVNLTAFAGNYTLVVEWAGVEVAREPLNLSDNMTEDTPVTVTASVFYPTLHLLDSQGEPVEHAFVYLTYANGTSTVVPARTDGTGAVSLTQVTGGPLDVRVLWRGVEVAATTVTVDASVPFDVDTAVYYLTVEVTDGAGDPLGLAVVRIEDAVFGLLSASNETGSAGSFVERLPAGTYDLDARWRGVDVGSADAVGLTGDRTVSISANVYTLTVRTLKADGSALGAVTVTVRTADGDIYEVAVTDGNGTAAVRTPGGTYAVSAHFAGTEFWSPIDETQTAVDVTVDAPKTVELTFEQVPGSFVGSNMFLALLLIIVLVVLLLLLLRRGGKQAGPEEKGTDSLTTGDELDGPAGPADDLPAPDGGSPTDKE